MSSIYGGLMRNWGCYRLHGEMRFEAVNLSDDEFQGIDTDAVWEETPGCPGATIAGPGLSLVPGYWRFRVSSGYLYGSGSLSLLVKNLKDPDSLMPLKSVDPEIDFFRTDLTGCLCVFEIKSESQVLIAVQSLGTKKGGLVYPLDVYLEKLT